jgi:hypothetical protein
MEGKSADIPLEGIEIGQAARLSIMNVDDSLQVYSPFTPPIIVNPAYDPNKNEIGR